MLLVSMFGTLGRFWLLMRELVMVLAVEQNWPSIWQSKICSHKINRCFNTVLEPDSPNNVYRVIILWNVM